MPDCPGCEQLARVMDRLHNLTARLAWVEEQVRDEKAYPAPITHMPRSRSVTKANAETLRAIRDHWAKHRRGPSYGELAAALGLKGDSAAWSRVNELRRKRLVTSKFNAPFTLRALHDPDEDRNQAV